MARQFKYLITPRLEHCNKTNLTLLSSTVLLQYAFVISLFSVRTLATTSSGPTCSLYSNLQSQFLGLAREFPLFAVHLLRLSKARQGLKQPNNDFSKIIHQHRGGHTPILLKKYNYLAR